MTEYGKTVHARVHVIYICMHAATMYQDRPWRALSMQSSYFCVNGGRQGILFTVLRR